eukprot:TRINITY_DN6467_c0_g1_i2.p1 TRINITY_DN6467_c0_g1~~TRINITY_DN6467_c0_g1_i2.p1  ORF type:complete len:369 (-),score=84.85 TRINITY_DN6467_c0_g1_i2:55-1161(-)
MMEKLASGRKEEPQGECDAVSQGEAKERPGEPCTSASAQVDACACGPGEPQEKEENPATDAGQNEAALQQEGQEYQESSGRQPYLPKPLFSSPSQANLFPRSCSEPCVTLPVGRTAKKTDWREETVKVWNRAFTTLPIAIDLPRLVRHTFVWDCRTTAARVSPPTTPPPTKTALAVKALLEALTLALDGSTTCAVLQENYASYVDLEAEMSEQKTNITALLMERLPGTRTCALLKAINQAIIAPANVELRLNICRGLMFKDAQSNVWEVFVYVQDDGIEVRHRRRQVSIDPRKEEDFFEFTWEARLRFATNVDVVTDVSMHVTDVRYGPKTSETRKEQLECFFGAYRSTDSAPPAGAAALIFEPAPAV